MVQSIRHSQSVINAEKKQQILRSVIEKGKERFLPSLLLASSTEMCFATRKLSGSHDFRCRATFRLENQKKIVESGVKSTRSGEKANENRLTKSASGRKQAVMSWRDIHHGWIVCRGIASCTSASNSISISLRQRRAVERRRLCNRNFDEISTSLGTANSCVLIRTERNARNCGILLDFNSKLLLFISSPPSICSEKKIICA